MKTRDVLLIKAYVTRWSDFVLFHYIGQRK